MLTGEAVSDITHERVSVGDRSISAGAIIWAAGVAASAAADWLGADRDRAGRVKVLPNLTVPGHPEISS